MEARKSFFFISLLNLASVCFSSSHLAPDVSVETYPSRPRRHDREQNPLKANADTMRDAHAHTHALEEPMSHQQALRELEGEVEEGVSTPEGDMELLEEKERLLRRIKVLEEDNRKLQVERTKRKRLERRDVVDPSGHSNGTGYSVSRPTDCADHLVLGAKTNGIYEIYPFTCLCSKPVKVYCDMETDGGGWTVFLTRSSEGHSQNFNRSWSEYKSGFGNAGEEFWMGNEHLHTMTFSRSYSLRMDVELGSGDFKFSLWSYFSVDTEVNRYKLALGQYEGESTTYTNCFNNNNGRFFTTYDRDYDGTSGNCAVANGGGFWHYLCSNAVIPTSLQKNGIKSTCFNQQNEIATSFQLKMRPSVCGSTFKTIYLNSIDCNNNCH